MFRQGPHPTKQVFLPGLHRPVTALGTRPECHLLPVTVVHSAMLLLACVKFSIYIVAVKVKAACRSQRCWTCSQMFWMGLACWASCLFDPEHGLCCIIMAISLGRWAHPCHPWWRRVLRAHQRRLLPMARRRRVYTGSTSLSGRDQNTF